MKTNHHTIPLAIVVSLVLSLDLTVQAQLIPPQNDWVAISPAQAATLSVSLGRLYRLSNWQADSPPLPPGALFSILGIGEDGSELSESSTNYAVYYSAAAQAIILNDTLIVAEQMLSRAALRGVGMLTEQQEEGEDSGGQGGYGTNDCWLEPVAKDANFFDALLHGATNAAWYLITSTDCLDPAASTWWIEGSLQATNDPMPFTLGIGARTNNLYFRAQPCDGECAASNLPLA